MLGDMVDRGPDPLGVIDMVRALPNVRVLMGNHEEMLYESLESGDERDKLTWHMNGGLHHLRAARAIAARSLCGSYGLAREPAHVRGGGGR
ncbi:MAG: metallophosphoesterase [Collinsella sp.]